MSTSVYENVVFPLLRFLSIGDAERAHKMVLWFLDQELCADYMRHFYGLPLDSGRVVEFCGIKFPGPIGLAAGCVKDGVGLRGVASFFDFVELGTVVPDPQKGNPRPRIFRYPKDRSLINRMGFNSHGFDVVCGRLEWMYGMGLLPRVLGISVGKNKDTPLEEAIHDYVACIRSLYKYGSYFVGNISSPNTPGLRDLSGEDYIHEFLRDFVRENRLIARYQFCSPKPLGIKLSPDMTWKETEFVLDACESHGIDFVVAVNTTTNHPEHREQGGLSGRPLHESALEMVRFVKKHSDLPIIGVGGIFDAQGAKRMLDAGADLIQLYTGFVYRGPGIVREIDRGLSSYYSEG